ncbi:MAG TPA: Stp1/IreP family PP2C-type Ser/Thr phosphatase [Gemmatimonadaceae bacterium]|nr:Stp1/IreP family PP2C-type Ser/Thr phosphatase [Gemmatimonadaceae bacterium]
MTSTSPRRSDPVNQPDHSEILVQVFGRTDVGRTREHNEDAFVVADLSTNDASLQPSVRAHRAGDKGSLFMVADGMGGAAAGEIASQMAIEIVLKELRENWLTLEQPSTEAFARCLKKAAQTANQVIHGYATSHQEYRGMGTTATIAGLLADTLYLAQVGDSRGYIVRDGVATQITKDQSLMQKLIEAGELTEEEAAQSERRNIILQALGPEATIKVDLTFQRLRRGDALVLCSDGLSGQVPKDEIARIVTGEKDLVGACRQLIDKANEAGGPDNITVIIARFDGEGLNEYGEGDEVGHRVYALNDGGSTPPMAMDRITESPTSPIRASRSRVSAPAIEKEIEADPPPSATPVQPPPGMDTEAQTLETIDTKRVREMNLEAAANRRLRGIAIAVALAVAFAVVASWYVVRTVKKVQPEPTPTAPQPQ